MHTMLAIVVSVSVSAGVVHAEHKKEKATVTPEAKAKSQRYLFDDETVTGDRASPEDARVTAQPPAKQPTLIKPRPSFTPAQVKAAENQ